MKQTNENSIINKKERGASIIISLYNSEFLVFQEKI
jgi:predicted HTH domain antitoxin